MIEDLNCDMASVLQNRDFAVLQKLIIHCSNFCANTAAKVEETTKFEIECTEKRTLNVNTITELQQEIEKLRYEIDEAKLQKKIGDKKILNVIKQQEELKDKVDAEKYRRESLTLDIVDLQQETEEKRKQKFVTWNAIKRACYTYKHSLDFHLQLNYSLEHKQVKASFFIKNPDLVDKYYVDLLQYDDAWKVKDIQPPLKNDHLNTFNGIIDTSKQFEISDITAFLCQLRYIFINYYINAK